MPDLTLPSGQTCVIRDPKTVSERLRRPVQNLSSKWFTSESGKALQANAKAKKKADVTVSDEDMKILDAMNDATIVALVESWSYDFPVSTDTLLDISGPDYDLLARETAKLFGGLLPSFGPNPDPDSPTEPSSD